MTSVKNLSCLIESSRVINSSLRLSTVLNKVTTLSKNILKAETGSLMLLDEKTKELVFSVALGKKGTKIKRNIRIKKGQGIAGTTLKTGKSIVVNNTQKDPRFTGWVDKFSGFKTHSIMCVPLKVKGKIIGVLEAINSHNKKGFSSKDLDIFEAFACQVAIAIDNAKMHQKILAEQKIDSELQIARQIQQNLLPKECISDQIDICGKNIPAEQVGGDLYDFFDLGDGKIGIMISDVSGKGIPAALCMMRIMSEFRLAAKTETDPGSLLTNINTILSEKPIFGMFVTLFYIIIDKPNKKMKYTSAGHPPALYCTKDINKFMFLDKAQNPPLGIIQNIQYKTGETDIIPASRILLYTDGVTEARSKNKEEYSLAKLQNTFYNSTNKNIIDEISKSLNEHIQGAKPHDDWTLVSVCL
jgi:sigma-B regulation protein RsbU (phosphoserine phosphatase)